MAAVYQLTNCEDPQDVVYTLEDLPLYGISTVGQHFQSVEFPNVCWELTLITDDVAYNGPTVVVTPVGPIFVNCSECLAGIEEGCTDPTACNYDPCATIDDGSCFYNNVTIRILCNDPVSACDANANCE